MKIKTLVGISLTIFGTFIFTIISIGLFSKGKSGSTVVPATANSLSGIKLTPQEVTKHNNPSDCWLIISSKVYDVTQYLYSHPGGEQIIAQYCGRDGTVDFQTKDRSNARDHSGFAYSLLTNYYLGDLNQTVGSGAITNVQNQTAPANFNGQDN